MPLIDTAIRNAKTNPDKDYKLIPSEKGMYVFIHKKGGKYFRLDYRFNGKRKTLALGVYPETTLKQAREKRDTAKKQIADGIDPCLTRKIEKAGSIENTFKAIAEVFLMTKKQEWSASHHKHIQECFERDVYAWIGYIPLKKLTAVDVLTALRRITARGAIETAARTKQFIGQAIALLKEIHPLTGGKQYVFANNQGKNGEKHINRESIGGALRRMGYKGKHTTHGFRTPPPVRYCMNKVFILT